MRNPSFRGECMVGPRWLASPEGTHKQKAPAGSPAGAWDRSCPSASRRGPLGLRPLRRFSAEQPDISWSTRYHTRFRHTRRSQDRCDLRGTVRAQPSLSTMRSMLPNDLEFSGEHRGSAATEVIVRCNSWLDSSSKKPSADRNDKESYRQRRQFLPVLTAS